MTIAVAYNTPANNGTLQRRILEILKSLRRFDNRSPLFRRYAFIQSRAQACSFEPRRFVLVNTWKDLVQAIRRAVTDSPLDEMIRLVHSSRGPYGPSFGVRTVVYGTLDEIPGLLGTSSDQSMGSAQAFPEAHIGALITERREEQDDAQGESDSESDDQFEGQQPNPDEAAPVEMPKLPEPVEPTQEEQLAAAKIQDAFRKLIARRRRVSKGRLADTLSRFFFACTKSAANVAQGKYLKLFLGPLPHILVCLDIANTDMHGYKTRTKKQLSNQPEDLDKLDEQLTLAK